MPRVTSAVARHKRKKRLMKNVKGYRGGRSKLLRTAKETLFRAQQYAYRDRRNKKREFRKLWIIRISAAARLRGLSYSKLMGAIIKANIAINRKQLAEMAVSDPKGFDKVVEIAKEKLA